MLAEQRCIAITTGLFGWCLEVWRYGGAGGFNLRLTEPTGFKGVNDRTVQFYSAVQMTVKILISTICLHLDAVPLFHCIPGCSSAQTYRINMPPDTAAIRNNQTDWFQSQQFYDWEALVQ